MGDQVARPRHLSTGEWGDYRLQAAQLMLSQPGLDGLRDQIARILAERDRLAAEVKRLSMG